MRDVKKITLFTFMVLLLLIPMEREKVLGKEVTFSDFRSGDSGYSEVISLVNQGVINGYSDKTFKPYQSISREHVAVMLFRAMKLTVPSNIDEVLKNYKDVNSSHTYAKEIAAVTKAGVFKGSSGYFNPAQRISRSQMATILVRAFNLQGTTAKVELTDINQISNSHRGNVVILAQNKITTGKPSSNGSRYFDGNEDLKRVQFAVFLDRAMDGNSAKEISDITTGGIVVGNKTYAVSDSLKVLFSPENKEILKGATIDFIQKENMVTSVRSLEIDRGGSISKPLLFNGGEGTIDRLVIYSDNILIKNLNVTGEATIAEPRHAQMSSFGEILLSDVEIEQLVVHHYVKIKILDGTNIENIISNSTLSLTGEDGVEVSNVHLERESSQIQLDSIRIGKLTSVNPTRVDITGNGTLSTVIVGDTNKAIVSGSVQIDSLTLTYASTVLDIFPRSRVTNLHLPNDLRSHEFLIYQQVDFINGERIPLFTGYIFDIDFNKSTSSGDLISIGFHDELTSASKEQIKHHLESLDIWGEGATFQWNDPLPFENTERKELSIILGNNVKNLIGENISIPKNLIIYKDGLSVTDDVQFQMPPYFKLTFGISDYSGGLKDTFIFKYSGNIGEESFQLDTPDKLFSNSIIYLDRNSGGKETISINQVQWNKNDGTMRVSFDPIQLNTRDMITVRFKANAVIDTNDNYFSEFGWAIKY